MEKDTVDVRELLEAIGIPEEKKGEILKFIVELLRKHQSRNVKDGVSA